MALSSRRRARVVAGLCLTLVLGSCGKKAPLRLPDSGKAQSAPALRARVREGRVVLDFRVPPHRTFPEREEPWVLARILRQEGASPESVEAGTVLEPQGFPFEAQLTWTDQAPSPPGSYVYRVEFRDGNRRRRAVTDPVKLAWERVPEAPSGLKAEGGMRSVGLVWSPPHQADPGTAYRVYRRESSLPAPGSVLAASVADFRYVDSRVETGREYCYAVRAVLVQESFEIEGPAAAEACAAAASP